MSDEPKAFTLFFYSLIYYLFLGLVTPIRYGQRLMYRIWFRKGHH